MPANGLALACAPAGSMVCLGPSALAPLLHPHLHTSLLHAPVPQASMKAEVERLAAQAAELSAALEAEQAARAAAAREAKEKGEKLERLEGGWGAAQGVGRGALGLGLEGGAT